MVVEDEIILIVRPHSTDLCAVMPVIDGRVIGRDPQRISSLHCIDVQLLRRRVLYHVPPNDDVAGTLIQIQANQAVDIEDVVLCNQRARTSGKIIDRTTIVKELLGSVHAIVRDDNITMSRRRPQVVSL